MILAALNFDFSFFTSIPGMLITGGVLLLIIALIIFIATSNKEKKTNKGVKKAQELSAQEAIIATTPAVDANVTPAEAMASAMSNTMASAPVSMAEPAVFTNPIPMEQATPEQLMQQAAPVEVVTPTAETLAPEPPVMYSQPVVEQTPVVAPMPQETLFTEVSQATPVEVVTPEPQIVPEAPKPIIEERPIYGGVSSVLPNMAVEEAERPIYGGANPLENTGSIQTVQTPEVPSPMPSVELVYDQQTITPTPAEPIVSETVVPSISQPVVEADTPVSISEPVSVTPAVDLVYDQQTISPVNDMNNELSMEQPSESLASVEIPTVQEPIITNPNSSIDTKDLAVEFPTISQAFEQPIITPVQPNVIDPVIPTVQEPVVSAPIVEQAPVIDNLNTQATAEKLF